jgi:hypothetical protein
MDNQTNEGNDGKGKTKVFGALWHTLSPRGVWHLG